MKEDLKTLPCTVNELYLKAMERIRSNGEEELAKKIFSWLFHSPTPMRMVQVRAALAIQEGSNRIDVQDLHDDLELIECCQGLLIHDESSGTLLFMHHTFEELLSENDMYLNPRSSLAVPCLKMVVEEMRVVTELQALPLSESDTKPWSAFLSHAYDYWGYYTTGEGEAMPEVRALIFRPPALRTLHCLRKKQPFYEVDADVVKSPYLHLFCTEGLPNLTELALHGDISESYDITEYLGTVASIDGKGRAAIHLAAGSGHSDIVRLLLEAGAGVNDTDNAGWTPLHHASEVGSEGVGTVELLIQNGADISAQTNAKSSVLHHARDETTLKSLLELGADPNATRKDGWTPLHLSAFGQNKHFNELLLRAGADIEARTNKGLTVLHLASTYECKREVLELFLNQYSSQESRGIPEL